MLPRVSVRTAASLAALATLAWSAAAPLPASPPKDRGEYAKAVMGGRRLLEIQASQLEQGLVAHPEDVDSRVRLISYYARHASVAANGMRTPSPLTDGLHVHTLWIVENRPKSGVAGELLTDPKVDSALYQKVAALWDRHLEQNKDNPEILWNAAQFFFVSDPEKSVRLLTRGKELEPTEPEWEKRLTLLSNVRRMSGAGGLAPAKQDQPATITPAADPVPQAEAAAAARMALATRRLADLETAMSKATMPAERTPKLGDAAEAAYDAGELEKAATYGGELLAHAQALEAGAPDDDAAFRGNSVLGRVALARGDNAAARQHLLAAATAPASARLNTTGPAYTLARELLSKGERDAVVQFLEQRKQSWPANNGMLDRMIDAVKTGKDPAAIDTRWGW